MQDTSSERNKPIVFAGRERELDSMSEFLAGIKGRKGNISNGGGLFLISGVQGIGKTQLVHRFMERETEGDNVRGLKINVSTLSNPLDCYGLIRKSIVPGASSVLNRDENIQSVAGVSVDRKDDRSLESRLIDLSGKMWGDKTLILFIDEIQSSEKIHSDAINTLHVLQEGTHGCPMMVVCAGIQNSQKVLSSHGMSISRTVQTISLGLLNREETSGCFVDSLKAMGFKDTKEFWVKQLCEATHGFPRHITCYLRAVNSHKDSILTDEDFFEILVEGDRLRYEYYAGRMKSLNDDFTDLLKSEVVKDLMDEDSFTRSALANRIVEVIAEYGMDKSYKPYEIVDQYVGQGIFTYDQRTGMLRSEIPSMKRYLLYGREERRKGDYPGEKQRAKGEVGWTNEAIQW